MSHTFKCPSSDDYKYKMMGTKWPGNLLPTGFILENFSFFLFFNHIVKFWFCNSPRLFSGPGIQRDVTITSCQDPWELDRLLCTEACLWDISYEEDCVNQSITKTNTVSQQVLVGLSIHPLYTLMTTERVSSYKSNITWKIIVLIENLPMEL